MNGANGSSIAGNAGSLWQHTAQPLPEFPTLEQPITTEVAVVGGGYTGLWTALFIKQLAPDTDVVVLEARRFGHGASGRNGGWLMGSLEGLHRFASSDGRLADGVIAALRDLVGDFKQTASRYGIDCDLAHAGAVFAAARYPAQRQRAEQHLRALHGLGFTDQDYRWLTPPEVVRQVNAAGVEGAISTPHVATLQPLKLAYGLVGAAKGLGVRLYENTPARITDGQLQTCSGLGITARYTVLATEGYSTHSPLDRGILSVQSGMVCTEPLDEALWSRIGFTDRQAFCDFSRASTYLQRSADNRLVIGARGSYRFNNRAHHPLTAAGSDTRRRIGLAKALFPQLKDIPFSHAWEGSLGVPRRFAPHVIFDDHNGLATAGGYLGEGVGASFLFGQTLAEGITGCTSPRLRMPWVQRGRIAAELPRWETEPLPWLGFTGVMGAMDLEDYWQRRSLPGRAMVERLCDSLEGVIGLH